MLVTVIVPVYKTEAYLDRCVSSIVNQTYRDLEIILVDDGSPDRCPELCDRWSRQDSRIRVIHKENAGQGRARNTGLDHAGGDYICFVDSDDYILPDTILRAVREAEEASADITIYGFILENSRGNRHPIVPNPSRNRYSGEEIQRLFLPEYLGDDPKTGKNSGIPGSACTCLISGALIRRVGWRFVSEREILCEDVYSMLALCAHVGRITVMKECLYCYCENLESTTHTYLPDRFERVKTNYEKHVELCRACGYSDAIRSRCAVQFLGGAVGAMKLEALHYTDRAQRRLRLRRIIDDRLLQEVLYELRGDRVNLKKRVLYWAMRHRCYGLCDALLLLKTARG